MSKIKVASVFLGHGVERAWVYASRVTAMARTRTTSWIDYNDGMINLRLEPQPPCNGYTSLNIYVSLCILRDGMYGDVALLDLQNTQGGPIKAKPPCFVIISSNIDWS